MTRGRSSRAGRSHQESSTKPRRTLSKHNEHRHVCSDLEAKTQMYMSHKVIEEKLVSDSE